MQALTGQAIAHPERLLRNLTRPRRTRRRRGSFGLVLGFTVLAGLLALAVRFLPLSHPALPAPPAGSVYNLG
jgi:hypothetical protein